MLKLTPNQQTPTTKVISFGTTVVIGQDPLLFVNGQQQEKGRDFQVTPTKLYWISPDFPIEPNDKILLFP